MQSKYFPAKTPRNALDILNSENRSLAFISNEIGETKVKALLTILITETLDFFSVTNSMSDSQIAVTINLIIEEYSLYKIDFFILCFNNAKKGKYGKAYNRIDGMIIFEWLAECDEDYTLEVENARVNEKKRFDKLEVENTEAVPMPEYVKEEIHKLSVKSILPQREVEVTEDQKIINGYISEFNKIHKEQDEGKGGNRFINVDGKFYDVSEYIQYKANLA